jgi:hypothetical protein
VATSSIGCALWHLIPQSRDRRRANPALALMQPLSFTCFERRSALQVAVCDIARRQASIRLPNILNRNSLMTDLLRKPDQNALRLTQTGGLAAAGH